MVPVRFALLDKEDEELGTRPSRWPFDQSTATRSSSAGRPHQFRQQLPLANTLNAMTCRSIEQPTQLNATNVTVTDS
jgi:hypothetical protein